MAAQKQVAPPVAALQNLIHGVAKNFVEKVYGPQGPAWGTSFLAIEDLAVQIGQAVSRQMLDQALQRQAAEPVPPEDQACPSCQRPLASNPPEPRIVMTRVGDAQWQEPHYYCPHCRRSFFPSVTAAGD